MRISTSTLITILPAFALFVTGYLLGHRTSSHAMVASRHSPATAQATARPDVPPSARRQGFESRYDTYGAADKATIRLEIDKALVAAESDDPISKAAAFTYHIYNRIRRVPTSAGGGAEVLRTGQAYCGGMVVALAEMLYAEGIKSTLAYTRGGGVAHSMTEAKFPDGRSMLLDPYHGVIYFDVARNTPVGIDEIRRYFASRAPPVLYARSSPAPYTSIDAAFSASDANHRDDYRFPDIFSDADGFGMAHSGVVETVHLPLVPGTAFGNKRWSATEEEPRPWSTLSQLRLDGRYVSWAYMLGDIATGYRVQHAYHVSRLRPETDYVLTIQVANAYTDPHGLTNLPAVTVEQIHPISSPLSRGSHRFILERRGFSATRAFHPQELRVPFRPRGSSLDFTVHATGDLVLSSIFLDEATLD